MYQVRSDLNQFGSESFNFSLSLTRLEITNLTTISHYYYK